MSSKDAKVLLNLSGGKWDKTYESARRVWDAEKVSPSIVTCGGGNQEVKIALNNKKPQVVGGIGEKKSNGGTQYYLQDRIYDGEIATTTHEAFQPNYQVEENGNLRIRKLTPRECFRLMGVKDEDFDKLSNMSNSTLYHLAGDSIVTTVLMAIFGELLEVEWKEKVNSLHRLNNDGRKE